MKSNRIHPSGTRKIRKHGAIISDFLVSLPELVKLLLSDVSYSPEFIKKQMRLNRYFPFHLDKHYGGSVTNSIKPKLKLQVTPHQWYQGLAFAFPSAIVTLILLVTSNVRTPLFLYPAFSFVFWGMFAIKYRHARTFEIDHNSGTYSFAIGDAKYVGTINNVYVRLSHIAMKDGNIQYTIVLDGRGVMRYTITTMSDDLHELRRLGKQIAGNLSLNYFDESNISPYHIVRHFPPRDNATATHAQPMHLFSVTTSRQVINHSKIQIDNEAKANSEESSSDSQSSIGKEEDHVEGT